MQAASEVGPGRGLAGTQHLSHTHPHCDNLSNVDEPTQKNSYTEIIGVVVVSPFLNKSEDLM